MLHLTHVDEKLFIEYVEMPGGKYPTVTTSLERMAWISARV